MDYSYDNFITKNPTTTLTREQFHARKTPPVSKVSAPAAGSAFDNDPDVQAFRAEVAETEAKADQLPTVTVKNSDGSITQKGSGTFNGNVINDGKPTPVKLGDKLGPNWTAALKDYETGTPVDKYESTYPGIKAKFKELAKNSKPRTDNFQSIESHEQVLITRAMAAIKDGKGKATAVAPQPTTQPASVAAQVDQPVKKPEQPTNVFNKPVNSSAASGPKKSMPNWEAALKDYETGTPVDHFEMQYPGVKAKFIELAKKNPPSMDIPQVIETHEEILATKAVYAVKNKQVDTPEAQRTREIESKPKPAQPIPPQTASQVEAKSAENASAKDAPVAANKTNVVNAPVTTNNNTTQVSIRPPIRNEESSNSRYAASRFAF